MKLTFHIWRQKDRGARGRMERYQSDNMNPDMSMLEALDVLNEELILRGEEPVAFEHDCREGICGSCGFMINGVAHGPLEKTTVCQLSLRHFREGREFVSGAVAGARVSGAARFNGGPELRSIASWRQAVTSPCPQAALRTATRFLFRRTTRRVPWTRRLALAAERVWLRVRTHRHRCLPGAKISHLGLLPQGQPERDSRALRMVRQMNAESFGQCTNIGECEAVCPKGISLEVINRMNGDFIRASWRK